jgi:hypothetical protein
LQHYDNRLRKTMFLRENTNNTKKKFIILGFLSILMSCSSKEASQEGVLDKKRIEPNVDERMRQARDSGGGIFNSSRSKGSTTFEFASSNVLWRATLGAFDSLPIANVDYSGGMILTDWYSNDQNSKESIKIKVQFTSSELATSSLSVISHKRTCELENCKVSMLNDEFNSKIKNTILEKARLLSQQKANEKKNK